MSVDPTNDEYRSLDNFEENRDWSSRTIHDWNAKGLKYSADLTPASMFFGTVLVKTLSTMQTATITNTSKLPLKIKNITVEGKYLVTHVIPTVIPPGESFDISVIFRPEDEGLSTGALYIDTGDAAGIKIIEFLGYGAAEINPDPDPEPVLPKLSISDGVIESDTVQIYISIADATIEEVTESAANLWVVPSSLSFVEAELGQSTVQTLTIYNIGTATLNITGTSWGSLVPSQGSAPFPFTRSSFTTSVQPGGNTQIQVSFNPTVEGAVSSSLVINSNSVDGAVEVPIIANTKEIPHVEYTYLSAVGSDLVDEDGEPVILKTFNWYGFEGILMPNGLWVAPYKTVNVEGVTHIGILDHLAAAGFNGMRLPICEDLTWPGRKIIGNNSVSAAMNPDLLLAPVEGAATADDLIPSIQVLDKIVDHCETLGIRIILDMHCLAPNTDNAAGTGGKWYTTSTPGGAGGTTGNSGEPRNEEQWITAWEFLANRYKNRPIVCGFDLINEPYNCTWDNDSMTGLPAALERCASRIHAINPGVLILCGGIAGNVIFPLGEEWGTAWGSNLTGVATRPVTITLQNKVVYTPHDYANLGAGAGPAYIYDPRMPDVLTYAWDTLWGYIAKEGIAPIYLGEFGGNFNVGQTMQLQWIAKLSEYMTDIKQSWAYWSANASADNTSGLQGIVLAGWESGLNQTTLNALQDLLDVTP